MKYEDLLRALTPFNYCDMKDQKDYMEKWSKKIEGILHYADADNDGTISFTEFFFFITLLQMPERLIGYDFQNMPDGLMTSEQFSSTLTKHRRRTKFGKKLMENNKKVVDARNVKAREEDFLATNAKITEKMFENKTKDKDGHRKLSFQDFRAH